MMKTYLDGRMIRTGIQTACFSTDQESAPFPRPGLIYVPQSHALALNPDISIVSGIRGSGKTFWWTCLKDETVRRYLSSAFKLTDYSSIDVRHGFGVNPSNEYPSPDTIKQSAREQSPESVWKAVIALVLDLFPENGKKLNRIAHRVDRDPEEYKKRLIELEETTGTHNRKILILFDGLDRVASTWEEIRPLIKGLFRTTLEFRSFQNIRIKLFIRPDMLEDKEITTFPDASKLLSKTLDLRWRKTDLYALVFQRLGNTPESDMELRRYCEKELRIFWEVDKTQDTTMLPDDLRHDEKAQSKLFAAIAGPTMAAGESGHKRGIPYSWLVNHLVDARDQVSPRSMMAALWTAAQEYTHNPNWPYPLDPKALQTGVAAASRVRRDEIIKEDYPWIQILLDPLKEAGLTVPCEQDTLIQIWRSAAVIEKLRAQSSVAKLPPRRIPDGESGVLDDLIGLGVFSRLIDGRIQMPDIFRIGFGIGRKGGVKPLK
jgi:hypothetical protein